MICQYWRAHRVVNRSNSKTTSTHRALISHAWAIHHNESGSARPQSMDGVNGCRTGTKSPRGLRHPARRPRRKACRASERLPIGCAHGQRRRQHLPRRTTHRPAAESQRDRHYLHAVRRPPVLDLRRLPQRGHPVDRHPPRADRRFRCRRLVEGDTSARGGRADRRAGRNQRHERHGGGPAEFVAATGPRRSRTRRAVGHGLAAGNRPCAVRVAAHSVCRHRGVGRCRQRADRRGAASHRGRPVRSGLHRFPDGPRFFGSRRHRPARRADHRHRRRHCPTATHSTAPSACSPARNGR